MHPALLALIVIGGLALLPSAIEVAACILVGVGIAVGLPLSLGVKAARKLVQKARRKEPAWPGRSQNFWR